MGDDIRDRFKVPGARRDFMGGSPPRRPSPPQPVSPMPNNRRPATPVQQPVEQAGPIPQRATVKPQRTKRKKSGSKKLIKTIGIASLFLLVGAGAWFFTKPESGQPQANQATTERPQTAGAVDDPQKETLPEGTIRLVATGSFATYDSIHATAKSGSGYNYLPLMDDIKPVFDSADIGVCQQETLGGGADKGVTGYPDFNAPFEWSKGLIDLGCNVFSLGSLHTYDKGQSAVDAAVKYFDDKDSVLATAGANRSQKEQDEIRYFEVKGLKFAMLSFTTQSQKAPAKKYGVNIYNETAALAQVKEARDKAHFVIVSMNWGKEDSGSVNAQQKSIAKALAAANVDLIIGNGPHVLQGAEILDGKDKHQTLVWYSLGNAVNSQLPLDNLIGGIGVVDIDVPTQNMLNPGLLPVYQHYEWTAAQKASGNFDARSNFNLFMLDQAASALKKSLNNTTVEAQTKRVKDIITKDAPIKLLTSKDFQ